MPFFRKYEWDRAIYLKIFLHYALLDYPYEVTTQWPLLRVIRGHMMSHSFLPLTFDRKKIERWEWSQRVSLAQTHRLICNMTHLGRHVTSRDLDLRPISDIYRLRSNRAYFGVSWRKEYDAAKIISLGFLSQKLFEKNGKKLNFDLYLPL